MSGTHQILRQYAVRCSTRLAAVQLVLVALTSCGGGGSGAISNPPGATTSNASPVASFSVSSASGNAPLAVQFDGSASTDSDGTITKYLWDFGDSSASATGVSASHSYSAKGVYQAKLTVTDNRGASSSATREIAVATPLSQIRYKITDFGTPDSTTSNALAINEVGVATGCMDFVNRVRVAFVWKSATSELLFGPPGCGVRISDEGLVDVEGGGLWDINTGGVMSEYPPTVSHRVGGNGFYYAPTQETFDISAALNAQNNIWIDDFNSDGQVVGVYKNPSENPNEMAFFFNRRTATAVNIGYLGGWCARARSLNDKGEVVGYSCRVSSSSHAFLWDSVTQRMMDLGDLPGGLDSSDAYGVNELGQVVGGSHGSRTPSPPFDTNTTGPRAMLWDKTNGMRDLNSLVSDSDPLKAFVDLWEAYKINEAGQIVAWGYDRRDRITRGYLLTPIEP